MRTEKGRSKPRLEEGEHSEDVGWRQEERGGAAPSFGQWSLREEPPREACPGLKVQQPDLREEPTAPPTSAKRVRGPTGGRGQEDGGEEDEGPVNGQGER